MSENVMFVLILVGAVVGALCVGFTAGSCVEYLADHIEIHWVEPE